PARILIVEDSPLVTDAFRVLFTAAGYEVDVAATVAEGIERGTSQHVDLMLLDLTLPDGNGLEILNALRERGSLPRATLAMTGHRDSASRRSCIEAGCAEVLTKPVPIGELLRQIERQLA
ncbi:MAG TPA: response regulator, partial [Gemmatimonadaceae bacterium]|nr:response regulator [Gemmatimonadaceae bacterium]